MATTDAKPPALRRIGGDPDWYEPYNISLAIQVGNLLFVSGQAGIDEHGRTAGPDFDTQARRAFANLATVLGRAGASLADVAKVTIMVTDMDAHLDEIITLRAAGLDEPHHGRVDLGTPRYLTAERRRRILADRDRYRAMQE